MKKLRCGFSHEYTNLWMQYSAKLLEVEEISRYDIDPTAVAYATEYVDSRGNEHHLKLEVGNYLRLTFIGNKGIPFTTYCTDTPEHREKYEGNVGKEFEIYVKEG